jgi:hypothetical protein
MTICSLQTTEKAEFLDKVSEVTQHSAWHSIIDEKASTTLLQDHPVMSYLIRQDSDSEYDYWLSHKKSDGTIFHRHFTVRLFPDGWFFANGGVPPCEDLNGFIQGALVYEN